MQPYSPALTTRLNNDFLQISNRSLQAMLQSDKAAAATLVDELQEHRQVLEEEGDLATSRLFKVLQVRVTYTCASSQQVSQN